MSGSSILYKFRSATNFEPLPLVGQSARLLDVKRAIVKAKQLDRSSAGMQLEFDLSVKNAATNEEYVDNSSVIPRGTRIVVQRLPAARGHGLLALLARGGGAPMHSGAAAATHGDASKSGFYTIQSHEEEDLVDASASASTSKPAEDASQKELEALMASTVGATTSGRGIMAGSSTKTAWSGGAMGGRGPGGPQGSHHNHRPAPVPRPNADPELREAAPGKKRATGIPRTFLQITSTPAGEDPSAPKLQPNAIGFDELVQRGGGQSESKGKREWQRALQVTATTIPEHLQCGICHDVVKNAMLLPWDPELPTACETCIRDALTQNGFRCPLTQQEGVSPDDLLPNQGLRKAADLFVKGVYEQLEEIDKVKEDATEETAEESILEVDRGDGGVVVVKKTEKRKKKGADDLLGDDDFGGDVFDVESDKVEEEEPKEEEAPTKEEEQPVVPSEEKESQSGTEENVTTTDDNVSKTSLEEGASAKDVSITAPEPPVEEKEAQPTPPPTTEKPPVKKPDRQTAQPPVERRERNRGPPAGYAMGPAGGAVRGHHGGGGGGAPPPSGRGDRGGGNFRAPYNSPHGGRGRGGRFNAGRFSREGGGRWGRGRGGFYGGRGDAMISEPEYHAQQDHGPYDDAGYERAPKRSRSDSFGDDRAGPGNIHETKNDPRHQQHVGPGGDSRYQYQQQPPPHNHHFPEHHPYPPGRDSNNFRPGRDFNGNFNPHWGRGGFGRGGPPPPRGVGGRGFFRGGGGGRGGFYRGRGRF